MFEIPKAAAHVLDRLEAAGHEAWLVGGCVRDLLLGRTPHDWDITTDAWPEETLKIFGACAVATGLRHGTVTVVVEEMPLEVTTYRVDGSYTDGRRPDTVRFVASLREDLARRDFTINAMAWHPHRGLADYFGGKADLADGIIRCVGEAEKRFQEDALRILRALRFAAVYNFCLDPNTAAALYREKELLKRIAWERIGSEIRRMIIGVGIENILENFADVLAVPIPEIEAMQGFEQHNPWHCRDVWGHTVQAVASSPPEETIRLALLFHDVAKPLCFSRDEEGIGHFYGHAAAGALMTEKILARLRMDNALRRQTVQLVERHDLLLQPQDGMIRRWLSRLGEEQFRRLVAVQRADALAQAPGKTLDRLERLKMVEADMERVLEEGACFSLRDLAVDGRDLMAEGIPEGPAVGRELRRLLDLVVENKIPNRREELLKEIKSQ